MTEIELMLALYHNPRTREVGLEMADRNRLQAVIEKNEKGSRK